MIVRAVQFVFASLVTTGIRSLPKTCSGSTQVTDIVNEVPVAAVAEHEKVDDPP